MRINFHDPALRNFYEKQLTSWLKNYATKNKQNGFALGMSGGANSSLAAYLCKKSGLNVEGIHILTEDQKLDSFSHIKIHVLPSKQNKEKNIYFLNSELFYLAEKKKLIVVGSIDGTKGGLGRFYHKWGEGAADIFPLLSIFKTDLATWVSYLQLPHPEKPFLELDPKKILHEEVWGFTIEELEWAQEENTRNGIVSNPTPPTESPDWFKYFNPRKQVISKLRARYRKTKHKIIPNLRFPTQDQLHG